MIISYLNPTLVYFNILRKPKVDLNYIISKTSTCEVPSIFLSSSYLMYKFKKNDTLLFKILGALLLITYIPYRLINFPQIAYKHYLEDPYYYTFYCIGGFTVLSYFWYYYLVNRFLNIINKDQKNKDE